MKYIVIIISMILTLPTSSQLKYYSADTFPLLGKATEHTASRYERLPDSLENIIRQPVWKLGKNSTGLSIRFRSNSTTIGAKWNVLYNAGNSNITPTNAKGLDLYCLVDGQWRFVNSG